MAAIKTNQIVHLSPVGAAEHPAYTESDNFRVYAVDAAGTIYARRVDGVGTIVVHPRELHRGPAKKNGAH